MQIVVSNIVLQVLSLEDFWQLLKMMNSIDLFFKLARENKNDSVGNWLLMG